MKKICLLILVLCSTVIYAQKNKKSSKKKPASVGIIVTNNDLSAELVKNDFYLFKIVKGSKRDTLLLKTLADKIIPTDGKITPFKANGVDLYAISWTEKSGTETKLKKEEITITTTQIWNPTSKVQIFANEQKNTKIREQVFLDRLKNASETQERTRNEGSVFNLLPDGSFTLKTKTSETKFVFNKALMKFEVKKK
jgi:hypothetical protein